MTENADDVISLLMVEGEQGAEADEGKNAAPRSGRGQAFESVPTTAERSSDDLPALARILRGLPAEARAEALEIAQALEISATGDELLYSLLVGLGYHKSVLTGVPDRISQAGNDVVSRVNQSAKEASENISQAINESAGSLISGASIARVEIQQAIKAVANQIQVAAAKGAQNAVADFDISPIVEKIASTTESGLAKKWFSRAAIICSISAVIVAAGAGFSGYQLAGVFHRSEVSKGSYYLKQLQCGAPQNGVISCRDQFGGIVKFRS